MLIQDHIKLTLDSPLCGANIPEFGPRFPDSSFNYSPALRQAARQVAEAQGITLREGVYMYMPGPQYESPAEIRAIRVLGADAVGMSTVPEVIVARHCGMEVLGITLLTNMAAGILDQPLSEEEVLTAAEEGKERFSSLILGCLSKM
jgi:purine-nucleoside phosphorylase